MAHIDSRKFVHAMVPILTNASLSVNREAVDEAFRNTNPSDRETRGVVMTYSNEAIVCLRKAFQGLQERISAKLFSDRIADAVQTFCFPFPEPAHNLTYAHFLFHGIQLSTLEGITRKIVDNGRIIHESSKLQHAYMEKFRTRTHSAVSGYSLSLECGDTDDFHGLSLRLYPADQSSYPPPMAKTGFLIDKSNATAIIINVQGRKILQQKVTEHHSLEVAASIARSNRRDAEVGREFARLTHRLQRDPRTYVIEQAASFLAECGLRIVKAIKPHEHVMYISGHHGFSDRYEPIIRASGLKYEEGPYLCNIDPHHPS